MSSKQIKCSRYHLEMYRRESCEKCASILEYRRTPISRARYQQTNFSPKKTQLIQDEYSLSCNFDVAINDISEEEKSRQLSKCSSKYKLSVLERAIDAFVSIFTMQNKLLNPVVFYVLQHEKEHRINVNIYKDIFEKAGYPVYVKNSETKWHQFIMQASPVLAHCASEVSMNPIANEDVKLGVFDFDNSCDIAKDASCFCNVTIGYHICSHSLSSSRKFFEHYYKELVCGVNPVDAYNKVAQAVQLSPKLFMCNNKTNRSLFINPRMQKKKYR